MKVISVDTLINSLNNAYTKSGIDGVWNLLIKEELKKTNPNAPSLASFYFKIGKKEEGLFWLEKAFESVLSAYLVRINNDPDYDLVRSEPRFQAILRKLGLSDYSSSKSRVIPSGKRGIFILWYNFNCQ